MGIDTVSTGALWCATNPRALKWPGSGIGNDFHIVQREKKRMDLDSLLNVETKETGSGGFASRLSGGQPY